MSLYGDYIKERLNKEIIETEKGFATYYFINDDCYIEEIYTLPQFRKTGEASLMADKITEIAKERGCKRLIGTVCPSAKGSTESLKVLLAYGFVLDSSSTNFIAMVKGV